MNGVKLFLVGLGLAFFISLIIPSCGMYVHVDERVYHVWISGHK